MKNLNILKNTLLTLFFIFLSNIVIASDGSEIMDSYKIKHVAEHTWVIHGSLDAPTPENKGFMNNPAFITSDKSVMVIDPGSNLYVGRALLKKIRQQTNLPITHVFNTHIHGDHWLGNQAFLDENPNVKIYAHPEMIIEAKAGEGQSWNDLVENLTNGFSKGTKIIYPTEELKDGQIFTIDNITIKVHLNEIAHTKTDAMFEILTDKVLITGDNAFNNRSPRLDDGSYLGNMEVLKKALQMDVNVVIPGHGPTGGKEILSNFIEFLSIVYNSAKQLMDEDMEAFEMKPIIINKMEKFHGWNNFDGTIGKLISVALLEAENEM